MQHGTSIPKRESNEAVLRWSEAPNSPSRQEFVEVIEAHRFQAVIRSTRRLRVNTLVYLTGKNYASTGVIRSCRTEGRSFLLRIETDEDITVRSSKLDPGVLAIDAFLTEGQEEQILKDLQDEPPGTRPSVPRTGSGRFMRKLLNLISVLYRLIPDFSLVIQRARQAHSILPLRVGGIS